MSVLEYRAIATKVTHKDGEIQITSAVEGGQTVRVTYGLAPVAALITQIQEVVPSEEPFGD